MTGIAVYKGLDPIAKLNVRDVSLVSPGPKVSDHKLYLGMPLHPNWFVVISIDVNVDAGTVKSRSEAKEQVLFRIWIVQTALSAANLVSSEIVKSIPVEETRGEAYTSVVDINTFTRIAELTRYDKAIRTLLMYMRSGNILQSLD